jgi:hypothetical protein
LEALHWHLQGISYHDFLLKIWVIKDSFLKTKLTKHIVMSRKSFYGKDMDMRSVVPG